MLNKIENFSDAEQQIRQRLTAQLKKILGDDYAPEQVTIDFKADSATADFTVPCFLLAKKIGKNPAEIASDIAARVKTGDGISRVVATGPYINIFVDRAMYTAATLVEIQKKKNKYGKSKAGKDTNAMVEYFSPNTNKPLTIGHLRNICLGWSISKIMKHVGYKVIEASLYNDRGIAIAKTMVAYQKWGKGKTPQSEEMKPDHFVGSYYVQFAQLEKEDPNLESEAKRMLQRWEEDEKEIKELWQTMIGWVLVGFKQTLEEIEVGPFDEEYFESEFYREGKTIVEKGLEMGIFKKHAEGYIYADLEKHGLPNKILLRADGTALYMTQDLYLASVKNRHEINLSINVVGSEQDLYFQQLFKIIELMGMKHIKNSYHLSYGMVRLPSGKIKSREGLARGTGADELLAHLEEIAIAEVRSRDGELSDREVEKRAHDIALGALKFYILEVNPKKTMIFDPLKSVAFNGRTGPYLQYVNARINSVFEKENIKPPVKADTSLLGEPEEFELVKRLSRFPAALADATNNYDPSQLANYLFELAKEFSVYYEKVPILKAEGKTKAARLYLIKNISEVLQLGLSLLGIPTPKKM